jgi:predicted nucleic acid-binding protein
MKGWVIDASIALAWALPDEGSPLADSFWHEIRAGARLHVPPVWWFECANALVTATRRGRLDNHLSRELATLLARLPIETSPVPTGDRLDELRVLASRLGLTAYDGAYVDLARRLGAGLATLDAPLAAAARTEGIEVFVA